MKFPRFSAPSNVSNFGAVFTEEDFGLVVECGFKATVLARNERLVFVNGNRHCSFADVKKVSVHAVRFEDQVTPDHFKVMLAVSSWNQLCVALEKREVDAYALAERITRYLGNDF